MKLTRVIGLGGFLVGIGCGLSMASQRRRAHYSFAGRSVLISGGSRGLGLVMARQLAAKGARLTLLARDAEELKRAEQELTRAGADVLTIACDIRRQEQVNGAVEAAVERYGTVDVLINNAGIIQVGPMDHMTVSDFEDALAIHLYGPLFCSMAVLPVMRRAGEGRIVNISSVGGKIAIPHLLPYSASKFALTGLSEGMRVELRQENIFVTTVCPGLMRTGSPRNALFKGRHHREYAWFAISDALPFLSIDAKVAARRILRACRLGAPRLVIGLHTQAAVLVNDLFPGAMAGLLSAMNRALPSPAPEATSEHHPGFQSESWMAPKWVTRLNEEAAGENNQFAE